jgi:hypothetical protein
MSRGPGPSPEDGDLSSLFKARQKTFLSSLQRVLSAAGNDEYIRQMFEHRRSAAFIPDRLCELIDQIVNDDREQFVQKLAHRLAAFEACFGAARAKKLEEIGSRLVELSSSQQEREGERRSCIRLLRAQLTGAQSELFAKLGSRAKEFDSLAKIEATARSLPAASGDLAQSMRSFENVMRSTFGLARTKVSSIVRELDNRLRGAEATRQRNQTQLGEIGTLKAQLQADQDQLAKLKQKEAQHRLEDEESQKAFRRLKQEAKEGRKQIRDLQEANAQLTAQVCQLQDFVDEQQQQTTELRGQLKVTNSRLQQREQEVATQEDRLSELKRATDASKNELQTTHDKLSQIKETFTIETSDLQDKLQKSKTNNQKLASDLEQKAEEVKILRQEHMRQVSALEDSLRKADEKLRDAQLKLKAMEEQHQVEVERLAELDSKSEEVAKLSRAVDRLREKVSRFQGETEAKNQQITRLENAEARLTTQRSEQDRRIGSLTKDLATAQLRCKSVESDLTRTTRDNKRLVRNIQKNRMQLAALQDTAAITEMQAARRIKELQRKLDHVCKQLNLSTVEQVEEFQEAVAADKQIIDDLRSITQADDLVQAVRELKEASERAEQLSEFADQMAAVKPERDALKEREQLLLKQLELESPVLIARAIEELQKALAKRREVHDNLARLFKTKDFVGRAQELIEEKRDLERHLTGSLNAASPSIALKQIAQLKETAESSKEIINRLANLLNVDANEVLAEVAALAKANADYSNREEQLMVALAVDSPDRILTRIDEQQIKLGRSAKILDALLTSLDCSKDTELVDQVSSLVHTNGALTTAVNTILKTLDLTSPLDIGRRLIDLLTKSQLLAEICQLMAVSNPDLLRSSIEDLIDSNGQFESLHSMFPLSQSPLREKIADLQREKSDLLAERSELESLLKSHEVVPAASQMVDDLRNCSELFSRLLGALSSSPLKITFPLSRPFQERLVRLLSDFKEKTNDFQRQVDGILGRAAALGFRGSRLEEAVNFIVASFVESEKQRLGQQMHAELMDVRRLNEKERGLAQKQRQKAKKRVAGMREALASIQERNATKEDELRAELAAEKSKAQQAANELEDKRRIHEELMLVIGGKAADSEYLRSKLSEREMKELTKAQEIRTYVEQMQTKQAEEQRRRDREDTFQRRSINPS